jgi:hypothetical protein
MTAAATIALMTACTSSPDSDIRPPQDPGYGESLAEAVEVCKPDGERAYLARLVCPGGEPATFDRTGGAGTRHELPSDASLSEQVSSARRDPLPPGEVDYHVVDGYAVACGDSKQMIYLDMYHCHQAAPTQAPPGFTLK